jgi:hypothetical protein
MNNNIARIYELTLDSNTNPVENVVAMRFDYDLYSAGCRTDN